MAQDNEIYLPQMGQLNKRLREVEKDLQKEFGASLKLSVTGVGSVFSIDAIVKLVSDTLSIPINRMLGREKYTPELEARQIAMYLCGRYVPSASLVGIGEFFDKDHSTVSHGISKIKDLLDLKDPTISTKVKTCESELIKRINPTYENTDIH